MRKFFRGASFYILIFIVLLIIVQRFGSQPQQTVDIEFSRLYKEIVDGNVKTIHSVDRSLEGTMIEGRNEVNFKSYLPTVYSEERFTDVLNTAIKEKGLLVSGEPQPGTPWFIELLPSIFMVLIFVVFWFVFMQQSQGGGNRVMSFGKSRAKLHKDDERKRVTFDDVAGLDEEKEELAELVDFLRNPRKYIELGARIPKGILMVGPPGTGKTYLTKAVAGEAGVPFFSISGSDFVEMFVGVGASRVRDLFEQAKKNAPCIIFIDEIDAVGRKRGAGLGGGHDEREQTLNQLLVEMDGFGINEGIIIVAATNRPDILDPALLRPGRFDRQVSVGVPDIRGREAILHVHAKGKPLAQDVDLKVLARRTPGFTPADIENLMNEAALLTARKNEKKIKMATIEEAITKVIAGVEKKSKVISEKERKLTAFHEAGHAVVATLLENVDPVHQVTIIPRGRAGGFTMILPKEDKYYATKSEMVSHIIHLLGGRVAEKLVLDDISTGASNDLQRVSQIARAMVTQYGMSEKLGPMALGGEEEVFLGKDFTSRRNYSEEVAAEIDREIREIVNKAYERTEDLLKENINKLHTIARALLKIETLDADQFDKIFNGKLQILEEDTLEDIEKRYKALVEEEKNLKASVEDSENKEATEVEKNPTKDQEKEE
ncbi:ATP-dependent zinc metalloprotease FtsH [Alkaliphilus serpentinus]|uniref:ATP-dependent zinc metalloprotease FtsH n=1 Tax=Alkaliphilus serpentinus TaxID=1482731 RepID=A0A833M9I7_9FIRM|nr:ATP-dependent zinc metalloprotease FtsH [Alkaliphilus serpentinus]KAB3533788.1 ATP-dependent zinc metalloprotease FtsH [Alkaliphilus serpentinus]